MVSNCENFDSVFVRAKNEQGAILAIDAETVNALILGFEELDV